MKIPLGRGEETEVDECDGLWISLLYTCWKNKKTGYIHCRMLGSGVSPPEYLHIIIARRMNLNCSQTIDHKDQNKLNNKRDNLREATYSQNNANSRSKGGVSRFKGVHKHRNRWQAQISINGKSKHLGLFDSPEEAALAYNKEAEKAFGSFAKGNVL